MLASSLMLIFSSTRVGTRPIHCLANGELAPARREPMRRLTSPARQAIGHGLAFALQGVVFLLLLDSAQNLFFAPFVVGLFAAIGLGLGFFWYRWTSLPHLLDMSFGMLTFGNLGMLLGWWADNGFSSLHDGGCSHCVAMLRQGILEPWMLLGMLTGANAAMVWFMQCESRPSRTHSIAMYSGGNLGMLIGMLAGGWCANEIPTGSVPLAVGLSFAGMSIGMMAGMLLGTWLVEQAIGLCQTAQKLPGWFRAGLRDTAG
jgi:hypothetical protein